MAKWPEHQQRLVLYVGIVWSLVGYSWLYNNWDWFATGLEKFLGP